MDPEIYRDHHLQHPRRRPAHRRHPRPGGRAQRRRAPPRPSSSTATATRRSRPPSPRSARAPRAQMRAHDRADPRRHLRCARPSSTATAWSNEPLTIALAVTKAGDAPRLRFHRLLAALRRADELGRRDHPLLGLPRDAPHLPRGADQRRRLRAAAVIGPRAPSSTPAIRGRSRAAPPRSASASPRRCSPPWSQAMPDKVTAAPAGTSGNFALGGYDPEARPRLRHVPDLRRRLRRQCRPRRAHQRLLDHRHLQDAAGRDDGAAVPGALPAATRCARAPAAPAAHRGGFGVHYEVELLRGEARALVRHGPRPLRPAGRAGRAATAAATVRSSAAARRSSPRTSPRPRTSRSAPATCRVSTPGGGGYGDPDERDAARVARDVGLGYYTEDDVRERFAAGLPAMGLTPTRR